MTTRSPALLAFLASFAALAAGGPATVTARRTAGRLAMDGALDESAWSDAVPFTDFVESFPSPGAAPTFRTEARVLYDDRYLYVGLRCFDPAPALIARQLGRRDSDPASDLVEVSIDSSGDRQTAYAFSVNAAGVLKDQILFGDVNATETWDGVWEAAAQVTSDGWTAELAVPLRSLRFASGTGWSIFLRRLVPRTHQVFDSALMPQNVNPITPTGVRVSRFGPLEGMEALRARRDIELVPYAGARATLRPQYRDPLRPLPRLLDPSLDLGLDFKIALTSDLALTGALNPDFGQVEADELIQNLSNQEAFFPEKRPLFTQGMDLFQSVGAEYGSPQSMFYSRRIGLQVPILTAAKVTGTLFGDLDVGLFDAVTLGAGDPSLQGLRDEPDALAEAEARPDRRWRFHPSRPLHFGPNDALPPSTPQSTNYLAAVARKRFGHGSSAGGFFTAATPLDTPCRRADFASDEAYAQARCFGRGANALEADWNLKDRTGEWGFFGQAVGSQQVGGDPEGRLLEDGTVLKPGDLGFGGNLRAGKLGGDPFRFDVVYVYEDRRLDLNAVGYQPLSNYQWADLNLHYVRPAGLGPFKSFKLDYNLDVNWSADGRWLPRGVNSFAEVSLQLPSFDTVGLKVFYEDPQYDTREITFEDVPFQRRRDLGLALFGSTDPSRRLVVTGDVFGYRLFADGAQPQSHGFGWDATVTFRPTDPLETRLDAAFGHKPQGARFLEMRDEEAVFGLQDPSFLSVTLRQQLVLTSRLTLQVYGQLFSAADRYGPFYGASLRDRRELPALDLVPTELGPSADQHFSALNVNAVLRWEYRLGSTLYLVYTRSQSERPSEVPSRSFWPSQLFRGPTSDSVMLKWSYWWNV